MICVIFTGKLEIPEDGYDVLDAKQFWYKVYALSVGDFDMLIQGRIQEFLIGGWGGPNYGSGRTVGLF